MIYLQMRIYLQSTDGNGMYNETLKSLWGEMKWNEKKIWWVYTLGRIFKFYTPSP